LKAGRIPIPKEIEKKFLIWEDGKDYSEKALSFLYDTVASLRINVLANGEPIRQGYLPVGNAREIAERAEMNVNFEPMDARIRRKSGKYYLAMKGRGMTSREEVEKQIPMELFMDLWPLTEGRRVAKKRLERKLGSHKVEFDVYIDGRDLIVAEIEVPSEEHLYRIPQLGRDVSKDPKYKNRNLAK